MVRQAWKALERNVAKAVQGHRIPRGADFSDKLPDVIASADKTIARAEGGIFAECKHSKSNPWVTYIDELYDGRLLSAGNGEDTIILLSLTDIHLLSNPKGYITATPVDKKVPGYMYDHITQSRSYIAKCKEDIVLKAVIRQMTGLSKLDAELPIVVMAQKYKSFRLCYVSLIDLLNFYSCQNDPSYRSI